MAQTLSTLKVLQDDRFDQEHRELLADVLLGDVDVYLREVLDKKWFDGGKILTFLCFLVFYTT